MVPHLILQAQRIHRWPVLARTSLVRPGWRSAPPNLLAALCSMPGTGWWGKGFKDTGPHTHTGTADTVTVTARAWVPRDSETPRSMES